LELEKVIGLTTTNSSGFASNFSTGDFVYLAGCVVVVYNVNANCQVRFLVASRTPKPLTCVAYSHRSGKFIAAGESGHRPAVIIWDSSNGSCIAELKAHKHGVSCLEFSPNGKHLVSVGFPHDGFLCLWDWRSGTLVSKIRATTAASPITSIHFSSDGNFFLTAGTKHLKHWTVGVNVGRRATAGIGTLAIDCKPVNLGSQKESSFVSVSSASYFGRSTVSAGQSIEMLQPIYALTTAGILCLLHSGVAIKKWVDLKVQQGYGLAVSDLHVACACSNGVVRLFMQETLVYAGTLPKPAVSGHHGLTDANESASFNLVHTASGFKFPNAIACCFSASQKLVVIYGDHSLYVWDVNNLSKITRCCAFISHSACIWDISTLPSAQTLGNINCLDSAGSGFAIGAFVTCSADGTIRLWDLGLAADTTESYGEAEVLHSMLADVHCKDVLGVIYLDKRGASLEKQAELEELVELAQGFRSMAVSADGVYLAAGDCSGNLRVYNLSTLDLLSFQEAHDADILTLNFSNVSEKTTTGKESKDHLLLASGGRDRLIHIYDMNRDFHVIETLDDHSASITTVKFACNSSKLLSCSADKSVVFRKIITTDLGCKSTRYHQELASYGTVYDMDIQPGNKLAVTVGQDKTIKVLSLTNGKPVRTFKLNGDVGEPIKVCVDQSGSYMICSHADKCMRIFDFTSGDLVAQASGHAEGNVSSPSPSPRDVLDVRDVRKMARTHPHTPMLLFCNEYIGKNKGDGEETLAVSWAAPAQSGKLFQDWIMTKYNRLLGKLLAERSDIVSHISIQGGGQKWVRYVLEASTEGYDSGSGYHISSNNYAWNNKQITNFEMMLYSKYLLQLDNLLARHKNMQLSFFPSLRFVKSSLFKKEIIPCWICALVQNDWDGANKHWLQVSGDSCIFVWKLPAIISKTMQKRFVTKIDSCESSNSSLVNFQPEDASSQYGLCCQLSRDLPDQANDEYIDTDPNINLEVLETPQHLELSAPSAFKFTISRLPRWAQTKVMNGKPVTARNDKENVEANIFHYAESRWAERLGADGYRLFAEDKEGKTPPATIRPHVFAPRLCFTKEEQSICPDSTSGSSFGFHIDESPAGSEGQKCVKKDKHWRTVHTVVFDEIDSLREDHSECNGQCLSTANNENAEQRSDKNFSIHTQALNSVHPSNSEMQKTISMGNIDNIDISTYDMENVNRDRCCDVPDKVVNMTDHYKTPQPMCNICKSEDIWNNFSKLRCNDNSYFQTSKVPEINFQYNLHTHHNKLFMTEASSGEDESEDEFCSKKGLFSTHFGSLSTAVKRKTGATSARTSLSTRFFEHNSCSTAQTSLFQTLPREKSGSLTDTCKTSCDQDLCIHVASCLTAESEHSKQLEWQGKFAQEASIIYDNSASLMLPTGEGSTDVENVTDSNARDYNSGSCGYNSQESLNLHRNCGNPFDNSLLSSLHPSPDVKVSLVTLDVEIKDNTQVILEQQDDEMPTKKESKIAHEVPVPSVTISSERDEDSDSNFPSSSLASLELRDQPMKTDLSCAKIKESKLNHLYMELQQCSLQSHEDSAVVTRESVENDGRESDCSLHQPDLPGKSGKLQATELPRSLEVYKAALKNLSDAAEKAVSLFSELRQGDTSDAESICIKSSSDLSDLVHGIIPTTLENVQRLCDLTLPGQLYESRPNTFHSSMSAEDGEKPTFSICNSDHKTVRTREWRPASVARSEVTLDSVNIEGFVQRYSER
ncbi:hypothetical protein KI387_004841, partial [Taxus chinensis]